MSQTLSLQIAELTVRYGTVATTSGSSPPFKTRHLVVEGHERECWDFDSVELLRPVFVRATSRKYFHHGDIYFWECL